MLDSMFDDVKRMDKRQFIYQVTTVIIIETVTQCCESETDFLAGAGASEKAPAPGCCCLA